MSRLGPGRQQQRLQVTEATIFTSSGFCSVLYSVGAAPQKTYLQNLLTYNLPPTTPTWRCVVTHIPKLQVSHAAKAKC